MFYTYFSSRGVDVAAYTSAGRLAERVAYGAPSFNYKADAERWISEVGNPQLAALKVSEGK